MPDLLAQNCQLTLSAFTLIENCQADYPVALDPAIMPSRGGNQWETCLKLLSS